MSVAHARNASSSRQIDLGAVEPHHYEVHERLRNWGNWSRPGSRGSGMHPMFRAVAIRGGEDVTYRDVDVIDAQAVQRAMPNVAPMQRHALAWCYIYASVPPGVLYREMNTNRAGLWAAICGGRDAVAQCLAHSAHATPSSA
jgi:hypothetical protein